MEDAPVLIGSNGQIFDHVLTRHHVVRADVDRALRDADRDLRDMRCAILASGGSISILKSSSGSMEARDTAG